MAAAARDDHPLDCRLANQARFIFASIYAMSELKEALFAVRVHVVGNR
jgi:hypothetical protein